MDSSNLFRKVAIERMSSPDQLDQLLRVTTPKSWLALVALIAIVGVAIAWGYMGELATKVSGDGVLIHLGGVQSVASLAAGQLLDLKVKVGDRISVGQVIGTVGQAALPERIRIMKSQIAHSEKERGDLLKAQADRNLQLQTQITDLKHELQVLGREPETQSIVISPFAGQVLELKVAPGNLVQAGDALISLCPDMEKLEALVFIPSARAKEVQSGMEAEISPSTVRREEYGFIRGKVTFVSDYPVTEAELMRLIENAPLVKLFESAGPVTEIRVQMKTDARTPSGYRWSSPNGAAVKLSGGTMCVGEIVTRKQRPISLVFPYVKESLGFR